MTTETTTPALPAVIQASVAALMQTALQEVTIATDFSITEQDDADVAATQLSGIKRALDAIEEERLGHTRPIDASKKLIMEAYGQPKEKLEQADQLLRSELRRWTLAENARIESLRRAEQARIDQERREAEERADKEAKRLEGLKTPEARQRSEARLEEAQAVVEQTYCMATTVSSAAKTSGFGLRDKWELAIEEGGLEALILAITGAEKIQRKDLLQYLLVNEKHAGGIVRAMKGNFNGQVPGLRAVNNPTTAVR